MTSDGVMLPKQRNSIWRITDKEQPTRGKNVLGITEEGHILVMELDEQGTWMWADGFPVGSSDSGDIVYSSWCGCDAPRGWTYVSEILKL